MLTLMKRINSENEGINIPARENEISNLSDIPSQRMFDSDKEDCFSLG